MNQKGKSKRKFKTSFVLNNFIVCFNFFSIVFSCDQSALPPSEYFCSQESTTTRSNHTAAANTCNIKMSSPRSSSSPSTAGTSSSSTSSGHGDRAFYHRGLYSIFFFFPAFLLSYSSPCFASFPSLSLMCGVTSLGCFVCCFCCY